MSLSGGLVPLGPTSRKPAGATSQFSYGFESDDEDDDEDDGDVFRGPSGGKSTDFGRAGNSQRGSGRSVFDMDDDEDELASRPDRRSVKTFEDQDDGDDYEDDDWDAGMDDMEEVKAKLDDEQLAEQYDPAYSMLETSKQRSAANMAALDELFTNDFPRAEEPVSKAAPAAMPKTEVAQERIPIQSSPESEASASHDFFRSSPETNDTSKRVSTSILSPGTKSSGKKRVSFQPFSPKSATSLQSVSPPLPPRAAPRPSDREFGSDAEDGPATDSETEVEFSQRSSLRSDHSAKTSIPSRRSAVEEETISPVLAAGNKTKNFGDTNALGSGKQQDTERYKQNVDEVEEAKDPLEDSWGADALDDLMPDGEEEAPPVPAKELPPKALPSPVKQPSPKAKASEEGYSFTFGRRDRRASADLLGKPAVTQKAPGRRASDLAKPGQTRVAATASGERSRATAAPTQSRVVTFSDSSDDEDLAISRGPRRARPWKGLASQITVPDAADPIVNEQDQNSAKQSSESASAPAEESSRDEASAPKPRSKVEEASGRAEAPATQPPQQQPGPQVGPALDVAKLIADLRGELGAIHAERVKDLEIQVATLTTALEAERKERESQESRAKTRICELEAYSVREQQARERAELALKSAREDHEASIAALKSAHEAALAQVRGSVESAVQVDQLAGAVGKATDELRALEQVVAQRHDESEKARSAQLECRERLVAEVEAKAREQLERTSDEGRKLQALFGALHETNQLVRRQCEEDRVRLGAEHARIEALQLTLKVESEALRNDAMDARARLREERAAWEAERAEWRTESHRKETAQEAERHALDVARRAFENERRASLREAEAALARVRQEDLLLRESRDAQAKTRVSLEEQAASLQREREAVDLERERNEREAARLRAEAEATQRALEDLRSAQRGNEETKELHARVIKSRSDMSREAAQLEQRKRELIEEECRQQQLRLRVTEERSHVYKKQAEAMREASAARALRRSLTVDAALYGGSIENVETSNILRF